MSPRPREDDWDFTPVIDLIYSLSIREEAYTQIEKTESFSSALPEKLIKSTNDNGFDQNTKLGNFDKIWQYLGQPFDLLPPDVVPLSEGKSIGRLERHGIDHQFPLKEVRWRDEVEGADLADNDENDDPCNLSGLTKAQRRKARRKHRHKERAETSTYGRAPPSGSEDESGKDIQAPQTPDRQSVIYKIIHGTPTPEITNGRLRSGKIFRSEVLGDSGALAAASPPSAKQAIQILKRQKDSAFAIAAARKAKLLAMLTETFIDERQYLSNVSLIQFFSTNTEDAGEGIHVFVDASNVCLEDTLKLCVSSLTIVTR